MTHIKTCVILIIAIIAVIGGIYFFRDRFDSEKFETVKTNMLLIEAKTKIIGEKVKIKAVELLAQALCHEIDHLNGITFVDIMEEGTLQYVDPNNK